MSEFHQNSLRVLFRPLDIRNTLALRILCRRHGVDACFTPTWNAQRFANDEQFCNQQFPTHSKDHPQIVQFDTDDLDSFIRAAKQVEGQCEAICLIPNFDENCRNKRETVPSITPLANWDKSIEIIEQSVPILGLKLPIFCYLQFNTEDKDILLNAVKKLEAVGCQGVVINVGESNPDEVIKLLVEIRTLVSLLIYAEIHILNCEEGNRILEESGINGIVVSACNIVFKVRKFLVFNSSKRSIIPTTFTK